MSFFEIRLFTSVYGRVLVTRIPIQGVSAGAAAGVFTRLGCVVHLPGPPDHFFLEHGLKKAVLGAIWEAVWENLRDDTPVACRRFGDVHHRGIRSGPARD